MSAMIDTQLQGGHGGQGSQEAEFSRLLKKDTDYKPLKLSDPDTAIGIIATAIDQGLDDASDTPDDEENPFVPAAYTYFGQFVDHDLTFDTRSTLETITPGKSSFPTTSARRGSTWIASMASVRRRRPTCTTRTDALRPTRTSRSTCRARRSASIPMTRSATAPSSATRATTRTRSSASFSSAFIQFHNAMIAHFKQQGLSGNALFDAARREVRFTYQKIVVTDFLKRVVHKSVYDPFVQAHAANRATAYKLYKKGDMRHALPMEFTGAAYRFGHSGIRNAYRLNQTFQRKIFDGSDDAAESLVGFGDLPETHQIDWSLFVTDQLAPGTKGNNPSQVGGIDVPPDPHRLQYAYKIDTSLVDPLAMLPPRIAGSAPAPFRSLAARNLKRGYNFNLPSGQDIAAVLGVTKHPPLVFGEQLLAFKDMPGMPAADAAALQAHTPLWLYLLAEGQANLAKPDGSYATKVEDGKTMIDKDFERRNPVGPGRRPDRARSAVCDSG